MIKKAVKTYLNKWSSQSGLSIIATVLALLLFSVFIAVAVSLITTGAHIGVQEEQGQQAFYIAEGGMHYSITLNKTNVPNYSTYGGWHNLGKGQFRVDTPAYLTATISPSTTTINVDSTASFPSAGRLTMDTDFAITYTGKTGTTFIGASVGQWHTFNHSVYPAAKLSATIPNDPTCTTLNISVSNDTEGFNLQHPFFIDNEYFFCAAKTQYQFQTCQRCYNGSSPAAHPSTRYAAQYILTSTGQIPNVLVSNVQRVVKISTGPE